jgi:hypothetical protein
MNTKSSRPAFPPACGEVSILSNTFYLSGDNCHLSPGQKCCITFLLPLVSLPTQRSFGNSAGGLESLVGANLAGLLLAAENLTFARSSPQTLAL